MKYYIVKVGCARLLIFLPFLCISIRFWKFMMKNEDNSSIKSELIWPYTKDQFDTKYTYKKVRRAQKIKMPKFSQNNNLAKLMSYLVSDSKLVFTRIIQISAKRVANFIVHYNTCVQKFTSWKYEMIFFMYVYLIYLFWYFL